MAEFVQKGSAVDYTPGANVASGAVVVRGQLVGISTQGIPANRQDALETHGVFTFPKATGGGTALAVGKDVFWDAGNQRATATAAGVRLGLVAKAAADADTSVAVLVAPPGYAPAAAVAALGVTVGGAFNQSQVQGIADKIDAVIAALKAAGLMASA